MSSFYGNGGAAAGGGGIDEKTKNELKNHIIFSKTQPTIQKTGDIWFVIVEDNNQQINDENNGD